MRRRSILAAAFFLFVGLLYAQDATFRGHVTVLHGDKKQTGSTGVVVWLTPVGGAAPAAASSTAVRLVQKHKQFTPHLLVIRAGTAIDFPNQDPFFHDVFSIYRGKPFDLGLYESGSVRRVIFFQPGVSYIFCNIHPEMSAIIVALQTPYFATTNASGDFQVARVPPGRYKLEVWYEFASESELAHSRREIEVGNPENAAIDLTLHSTESAREHLNKYGEPYAAEKQKY